MTLPKFLCSSQSIDLIHLICTTIHSNYQVIHKIEQIFVNTSDYQMPLRNKKN